MEKASGNRFQMGSWYPCYNVADVDSLMERIEATLSGAAGPDQVVTGADVRAARFRTTRRKGYDQRTVDDALDIFAQHLDEVADGRDI